jgi:hypothetical protein
MNRLTAWLAIVPLLGACASSPSTEPSATPRGVGGGGAGAAAAPALAYTLTAPASATYNVADTAVIEMEAGGQTVRIDVAGEATARLDLSPAADGIRATVRITELSGAATNPMGPAVSVSTTDLPPGSAEVAVSRTGRFELVSAPDFSPNLRRVVSPPDFYRRFFMRLPAANVQRGGTWTDTVSVTETVEGLSSETQSIVTSTWERDTTVGGRALNVIVSRISTTAHVSGTTDGVQIAQTLAGSGTATTLWDPVRRLIVQRTETGTSSGETDLPAMGISDLPTTARASRVLRLAG